MNIHVTSTMAAALLASAGWCASAAAQDKAAPPTDADKSQVVPAKKDMKPYPATVEKLDDNAQRIHDRDSAATPQRGVSDAPAGATEGQAARVPEGVRDWAAIDKNKDNLISPDEMEAALKEGRPPSDVQTTPASK